MIIEERKIANKRQEQLKKAKKQQRKKLAKENKKQISMYINESAHTALKDKAKETGKTLSETLEDFINEPKFNNDELNAYLHTFKDRFVESIFALEQLGLCKIHLTEFELKTQLGPYIHYLPLLKETEDLLEKTTD